jgi:AbiJ N-terminal domain 3/Abortive infection C-terminus
LRRRLFIGAGKAAHTTLRSELMAELYDDLFDERADPARWITQVTRRDIFDYIRTEGRPWWGRMDEIAFLARLYDLERLPSTDSRFATASRDIFQHRVNNDDWDDDWVFHDSRLQLASGPDEVLLGFLAQMVHPVVQPDAERAAKIVADLNELLAPDGWMLKEHKQMSGRPVYAPARIGTGAGTAVGFAHEAAARIDAGYISQQVTRMEGAIDTDPELAIGTAKEFVESICKTILDERGELYTKTDDLPALLRKTTKVLQLTPDDVANTARAAEIIKRMLMNLATIVQGSAELRNAYGTGHGKSKTQARQRLKPRHARLAVGSAATLGTFLYETHEARP